MRTNLNLHKAKDVKNDEFYTQLSDVEKELQYYKEQFKGRVVYCNCDNPTYSAFWKYFHLNFKELGLKKLIATHYSFDKEKDPATVMIYEGGCDVNILAGESYKLEGDGDFRSEECTGYLKEADIVVTNPPFSLFRDFVSLVMMHSKKCLLIGNMNAITYKEVFRYILANKLWLGVSLSGSKCSFIVPENYEGNYVFYEDGVKKAQINNAVWFTNLDHIKRHETLVLSKTYSADAYVTYDNYSAINVNKYNDIPMDYDGVMGVPITYLYRHNPERYDIVGWSRHNDEGMDGGYWNGGKADATIDGKEVYRRILIRRRK